LRVVLLVVSASAKKRVTGGSMYLQNPAVVSIKVTMELVRCKEVNQFLPSPGPYQRKAERWIMCVGEFRAQNEGQTMDPMLTSTFVD
jgi:hypothetical protein